MQDELLYEAHGIKVTGSDTGVHVTAPGSFALDAADAEEMARVIIAWVTA